MQALADLPTYDEAQRAHLQLAESPELSRHSLGATSVALLGYFASTGGPGYPIAPAPDENVADPDVAGDVAAAYTTPQAAVRIRDDPRRTDYARAAVPLNIGGTRYVLAVRKPINEINGAVGAVSAAFLFAALAGLAADPAPRRSRSPATLVRRLRRLRQAALQLADRRAGRRCPVDRARDEVGDLARTFAIMQRRLRQQEEARRAFVATASHELRTPLTSLDGMLELLDDDLHEPAARPRGRARAARPRPRAVAPPRPARRRPARSQPDRRRGRRCAPSRSSSAS